MTHKSKPIVVLHIFGTMDRGGAELRTLDLIRRLDSARIRTIFGTLSGRAGALEPEIEAVGAQVISLGLGPRGLLRFWRTLRQHDVDVVHSHVATFSGLVLFVARLAGVPGRIAHFRSDSDKHGNTRLRNGQRWIMRSLIARHATDVVGVSPAALQFALVGIGNRAVRTHLIPSGLETSAIRRAFGVARILGAQVEELSTKHAACWAVSSREESSSGGRNPAGAANPRVGRQARNGRAHVRYGAFATLRHGGGAAQ